MGISGADGESMGDLERMELESIHKANSVMAVKASQVWPGLEGKLWDCGG